MKTFGRALISLSACFTLWACGGGDDPDKMNPGTRVVERYIGGGTGGGALDGKFSVFVEDRHTDQPLGGVTVLVVAGSKTLNGQTNAEGLAEFDDGALNGTIDVHMFKSTYVYESIIGLGASVATFRVGLVAAPMLPDPPSATVKGNVTGWELITAMGTPIAQVLPIGPDIVEFQQRLRGGTTAAANLDSNIAVNAPNLMLHDYELALDIRTKALLVAGGTLDQAGVFTADHVGLASPINAAAGATINQDVALTHALDQSIAIDISGPAELTQGSIRLGFQLANGLGEVSVPYDANGQVFRTPSMSGAFAGAKLIGYGSLQTEQMMTSTSRSSAFTIRELSGTMASLNVQDPPGAPSAMGRTLGTSGAVAGAHLHEYYLGDRNSGDPLWSVTVFKGNNVTFPTPPMGFSDPIAGEVLVTVVAEKFGGSIDVNNLRFDELDDNNTYDESEYSTRVTF